MSRKGKSHLTFRKNPFRILPTLHVDLLAKNPGGAYAPLVMFSILKESIEKSKSLTEVALNHTNFAASLFVFLVFLIAVYSKYKAQSYCIDCVMTPKL